MRAPLTAIALSLAMITASNAADLGRPVAAPVYKTSQYLSPAPAFTWTGFYVGLTAGYGWGNARIDSPVVSGSTFRTTGGNLGSTLGYNWQSGSWVYGLETDLSLNWIKGSDSATSACPSCEVSSPWFGTFRGRLGYSPAMTMYYLTGGLAYGGVRVKNTIGGDERHNHTGWALGAGIEHAFDRRWSAKLEYLYVDLGNTGFGGGFFNTRSNENIVRVGLNAHF